MSISPKETRIVNVHYVLPRHANVRGRLYGGHMMNWIVLAGSMVATRVSRSPVVLASMDDLYFVSPVEIGDIVTVVSQADYVGRTSMEVSAWVFSQGPEGEGGRPATVARMTFVALDENCRPRPVGVKVEPRTEEERLLYEAAMRSREERLKGLGDRRAKVADVSMERGGAWSLSMTRAVFPEDAIHERLMFAGRLLMMVDELAGILAVRYARSPVVTGSVDAMSFYSPIMVGDVITMGASLNYVGVSSMEIGVKVVAENPLTGEVRHTCTLFTTYVSIGPEGSPRPLQPYIPQTELEKRRWAEAAWRRERRLAKLKEVQEFLHRFQNFFTS